MAVDHGPVQNSEVYLMNSSHPPSVPPPSPPSPATPCELEISEVPDLMSMTPPEILESHPSFAQRISNAVHVLGTEATALSFLTRLYETDQTAQRGFNAAVEAITRYEDEKGKLVISGVGKSGHIAKKLVATMNSLKIHATYLHPTEALHGDLGKVGKHDTILLITFSGKTPELLSLLPHFNGDLPIIVMTSHTHPSTCEIVKRRPDAILLPAPIHKSETECFGFSAPTISTTMALALGDALAVVISQELHVNPAAVFGRNHPGGAIGDSYKGPAKLCDIAVQFTDIPEVGKTFTGVQVLMSAYRSETGWVRNGDDVVVPPRRIRRLQSEDMDEPAAEIKGLMVPRKEWISIAAETSLPDAKKEILRMQTTRPITDDAILALMDDGELCAVIEVGDVLQ